mmetsp:Transcript_9787/g.24377  ORF Transcript_9787/g.24377 Transcript_9787/m.24377 type:complete len:386 (+) Transcript_9787:66-1223(+)
MGCGGSKNQPENVGKQRRRLSVGEVDKTSMEDANDTGTEDDRGVLATLDKQTIIDMIGDDVGGRKLSIGTTQDAGKTSFANKSIQSLGDECDPVTYGLGYTCRKGLKPESPNQDAWCVMMMGALSIYAVFDGHGQKGHDVSFFVKENLPKLMIKDQRFKTDEKKAMLVDVFKKIQSLVALQSRMQKLSADMSGTTATVCIHDHERNKLTIAHVADSTAVIGTLADGKNPAKDKDAYKGEALTRDHKPDLKDERSRIEKAGGRVVFDGYANHRVYAKNARYPGLNMSRCLGDLLGHQDCGITAEPETSELAITPADKILLLCSDGVWEFIEPTEAVKIAMVNTGNLMKNAEKLAKEAWDRWIREEGGAVVDDITVVLVSLTPAKGD